MDRVKQVQLVALRKNHAFFCYQIDYISRNEMAPFRTQQSHTCSATIESLTCTDNIKYKCKTVCMQFKSIAITP